MLPVKRICLGDSQPEKENEAEDSVHCDPVGNYIITLRTYYRSLVYYEKNFNFKNALDPVPSMPEYPKYYPTPEFLRQKRSKTVQRLVYNGHLSKKMVDSLRAFAIKRIIFQTGFDVDNTNVDEKVLMFLAHVADIFLQNFMGRLRFHKNSNVFCESQDLWNPLETTLQELEFNGVNGIAMYYFGEYVDMCETLRSDCLKQLQIISSLSEQEKLNEDKEVSTSTIDIKS